MSRVDSADPTLNALVIAVFHLDLYEHISSLTAFACVVRDVNLRSVIHGHKLLITSRCRLVFIEEFEFP